VATGNGLANGLLVARGLAFVGLRYPGQKPASYALQQPFSSGASPNRDHPPSGRMSHAIIARVLHWHKGPKAGSTLADKMEVCHVYSSLSHVNLTSQLPPPSGPCATLQTIAPHSRLLPHSIPQQTTARLQEVQGDVRGCAAARHWCLRRRHKLAIRAEGRR
jgi:hypothetical protein